MPKRSQSYGTCYDRDREPREASITSVVRTGFTLSGWVIGPASAPRLPHSSAIERPSPFPAWSRWRPWSHCSQFGASPLQGARSMPFVARMEQAGPRANGRSWGERGL